MRFTITMRILSALVLAILIPAAYAQKSTDTPAAPKYDVTKEVTAKGVIDEVKEMTMAKGEIGIHLMVKTSAGIIEVRLCPSGYLKDFEIQFAKGQDVTVTGSKIQIQDKDVILAREIVQGNNTVTLRDKSGAPVWTWLKKG